MSLLQKLFALLGGLFVFALAAILVVPMFIDWNAWKPEIEYAAADAGLQLRLNGDISASLLPSPTVSIGGLVIEQSSGLESDEHFLTLGQADVKLAFAPLLGGKVRINSVALSEGHLVLHQNAEGTPVLPFQAAESQDSDIATSENASQGRSSPENATSTGAGDFRIDDISLKNLAFTLVKADGQREEMLQIQDLHGALEGLQGPVRATGNIIAAGQALGVDVKTGLLREQEALPLSLGLTLENGVKLLGNLRVVDVYGDPEVTGKVTVNAADAAVALQQDMLKPGLALSGTTGLRASTKEIALNDLAITLGRTRLSGGVNVALGDKMRVDVSLATSRASLDELLNAAPSTPSASAKGEASTTAPRAPGLATDTQSGGADPSWKSPVPTFSLPADVAASLTLQSDVLMWQGQAIRDIALEVQMDNGVLDISKANAQLPGGSRVTVAGLVSTPNAVPDIAGRFRFDSQDLRGLADWAGIAVPPMRPDRLQRSSLEGLFRVTPSVVQLYGLKGKLDVTTYSGAVTAGLRQRPAYGLELEVDQLSLSDYLPRKPDKKQAGSAVDAASATNSANGAAVTAGQPADLATQLAVLNDVDAQVKLTAGKLQYDNLTLKDVALDGVLLRGKLDLRRLSVDRINRDGSFAASGTIEGFGASPLFDVKLDGRVGNLTETLIKAGQVAGDFPQLGKAGLKGRFSGKAEQVAVDARLSLMGGAVSWKGSVAPLETSPRIDLVMTGKMPRLVPLMRMADPAFRLAGRAKDKGIDSRIALKGTPLLMHVDGKLSLAGGVVTAKGKIDTFGGPLLDGKLGLDAKAGLAFLHGIGVDYHPAAKKPGRLRLSTKVTGNQNKLSLKELGAQFGLVTVNGQADLVLTGKRPVLTGSFKAGDVIVDPYLPLSAHLQLPDGQRPEGIMRRAGRMTRTAAAQKNSRWSTEVLDLSVMGLADADLNVTAKSIQQGRYIFDQPELKLSLQDRVLRISELKGGLFDGNALVTAVVDGRRLPTVTLQADVKDSQLEQVLRAAAGLDSATGVAGLTLKVNGQGRSQYDIVSSLKGSLDITSLNGVVRGINLQALNQGLHGGASDAGAVLQIALGSFAQGETRYASVGGHFDIANGVMTSNDITANLDGGTGRGVARIDLPAWFLDSKFRFKMADQKSAPEFGLDMVGPIDNPQRKMRIDRLKAHFVGKGLEGLIKSIGNGKSGSNSNDAPAQLLNNLFKNLQKQ